MKTRKKAIRKPSEVYQACPECKSKELLRLEVDVLCADCDWMSCEEYVEMGGMDNLFTAFRDHFPLTQEEEAAELIAASVNESAGVVALRDSINEDALAPVEVGA
jgi:hypothetical protein